MWPAALRRVVHASPVAACISLLDPAPLQCHEVQQSSGCSNGRPVCRTTRTLWPVLAGGASECEEFRVSAELQPKMFSALRRTETVEIRRQASTTLGRSHRLVRSTTFVYDCVSGGKFEDTYEVIKGGHIDEGAFGTVVKVKTKETGYIRAAKMISKSDQDEDLLKNEITALMDLDHPHIVKLVRYFDEGDRVILVFELCSGPDLHYRISSMMEVGSALSEWDSAVALRQMLKAVRCCHNHYLGHYDVKPENFMYTDKDLSCLKMIDLGLSSKFCRRSSELQGTIDYMAPEIFQGIYGPEADVWSCGVVLFLMLTGSNFFEDPELSDEEKPPLITNRLWVRKRLMWAKEQGLSDEAVDLLKRMLSQDRYLRISVRAALQHPFIAKTFKGTQHELRREAYKIIEGMSEKFRSTVEEPSLKQAVRLLMAHIAGMDDTNRVVRYAFRLLDRTSSGELSVEAIEIFLQERGKELPADFEKVFKSADVNDDGYINFLEFVSINLPDDVLRDKRLCQRVFRHLDRDHDGFITPTDLSKIFHSEDEGASGSICLESLREVCTTGDRLSFPEFYSMMCRGCADDSSAHE